MSARGWSDVCHQCRRCGRCQRLSVTNSWSLSHDSDEERADGIVMLLSLTCWTSRPCGMSLCILQMTWKVIDYLLFYNRTREDILPLNSLSIICQNHNILPICNCEILSHENVYICCCILSFAVLAIQLFIKKIFEIFFNIILPSACVFIW